jgi:signal transduction histidine kinase/CheY-like chemotaxis protein/HPt (histidine-containing phosphotransfer) domain-containing protein
MDSSNAISRSGAGPQPSKSSRRSLREVFESLPLAAQFRVAVMAAVTVTLLAVQFVFALWDTRFAREQAIELASSRTASMAARLEATGGGALDNLEGHPELLAATFRLQGGDVLQSYYRDAATATPGSRPPAALAWTSRPGGALHWVRQFLALEPIYVANPVQLSQGLTGTVSILVDHRWIWSHALRRAQQAPVALLLGFLVALAAANALKRQVAEPLAQLVRTTRPSPSSEPGEPRDSGDHGNELTEIAANFESLGNRVLEYEGAMSALRLASSQQIVERTRELEQRLRRAEALTRSKDDFLANMSHEIRTPMNGVLGMAELLAGTELDKRQRRFVDSMRAAAETMMRIINDILDDSKIEAGKMDLVQEPFDVRELAEQAGQLYAGQAESKKLEMICRIEPTVPSIVVGDALRLRQVLGNLLSNAVKYTDHGEIEIRVGLDDSRDGQCRLHFSIRDTGPGIPAADHTGVFEAFTQLDNGSRTGGTGLGLSIANRLVRLMGGEKIALASEVGRGSTFSFVLPFEIKVANAVPNRASDEFSGLRVLVVDDNATSYMLLEEMLANWSVEVSVLNRARLVGDRMHDVATRGKPFDIVLLDHNLPDATTEQLLRTIRLDPAIAGTYVVLLSALDFNASYEGTQAIAPDVCIAKPVREQLLRSALEASRQPRKPFLPESAPVERVSTTERSDQPALGLNVLVADDNAINREVAVAMLEELDCTVALAEDGHVAVANAQQRRFDAILMDCQMPGMDGYEATEAIRRHENERGLPPTTIIALTANVMARDRERCIASGMNAFLAKPFKAAQLLEVLRPVADAHAGADADARARADSSDVPVEAIGETPPETPPEAPPEPAASVVETPPPAPALTDVEVDDLLDASIVNATPISRLPVLDLEQVQAIRGLGKPLVFERLCEMLFSSSKEAFARLDAALAEGNLEEVAAAAHAFRSPVSNLGGRRLADLLERCETAALEHADLTAVRRTATGLKPHYAALVAALEAETRRGKSTG